jgi:hypothetical protein
MFACTYLARSSTPAYAIAISALCLGFATFVHFLVLCHPLAHGTNTDPEQQNGRLEGRIGANLAPIDEHLFMHACLAANLRVANVLLWSGGVRKEHAAFVVRFLWRQGIAFDRARTESPGQDDPLRGPPLAHPKDCAAAVFELSRAVFPDFVALYRDDLWAEVALAWAHGGASRQTLQRSPKAADPSVTTPGPHKVHGFGDTADPEMRDEPIR